MAQSASANSTIPVDAPIQGVQGIFGFTGIAGIVLSLVLMLAFAGVSILAARTFRESLQGLKRTIPAEYSGEQVPTAKTDLLR